MDSYSKLQLGSAYPVAATGVVCSRGLKTRRCDGSSGKRVNIVILCSTVRYIVVGC